MIWDDVAEKPAGATSFWFCSFGFPVILIGMAKVPLSMS